MKKLITLLLIISATTSVFAKDCNSRDLNREYDRIQAIDGIDAGEKSILFEGTKAVKLTEILTCSGLKRVYLSDEEASFAKYELNKDRIQEIDKIKSDELKYKSLLQDTELEEVEREIFLNALKRVPARLQAAEDHYSALIKYIRKSTW